MINKYKDCVVVTCEDCDIEIRVPGVTLGKDARAEVAKVGWIYGTFRRFGKFICCDLCPKCWRKK